MFKFKSLALIATATLVIGLAGCQVRPLHSTTAVTADGSLISSELKSVEIAAPSNRIDQVVRNELTFLLLGGQLEPETVNYKLNVSTSSSTSSSTFTYFVNLSSSYTLTSVKTGEKIASGSASARVPFEYINQDFANSRAERDAQNTGAKQVAEEIRREIVFAITK